MALSIIFRIICLVTLAIGSIFGGVAYYIETRYITNENGSLFELIPMAAFAFSLLWNLIILGLRGCRVKVHPGFEIAFDLIAFGASFGMGLVQILFTAFANYHFNESDCISNSGCNESHPKLFAACIIIEMIMALVNGISHFIVFVRACIATHMLRKQRCMRANTDPEQEPAFNAPKLVADTEYRVRNTGY